jgi:hypothetical protein
MKNPLLSILALVIAGQVSFAESPAGVVPSGTASARDGFTRSGTSVLLTRGSVSRKVEKEVVLANGLRVQSDGTVTLFDGSKAALRNNQLLTLEGTFEEVALTPQGTAPVSSGGPPMKKLNEEVGISSVDGVCVSSGAALVTRNGVTERLSKEVKLANGARVQPDGTVILLDGTQFTLKVDQVLTFDGMVRAAPVRTPPASGVLRDGGAAPSTGPSSNFPVIE